MYLDQIEKLVDVLQFLIEQMPDEETALLDKTALEFCSNKFTGLVTYLEKKNFEDSKKERLKTEKKEFLHEERLEIDFDDQENEETEFLNEVCGEGITEDDVCDDEDNIDDNDEVGEPFEADFEKYPPGPSLSKAPVKIKIKKEEEEIDTIFRCILCEEDFVELNDLELHDSHLHVKEGRFQCKDDCNFNAEDKKSLVKHFAEVHKDLDTFSCPDCDELFFTIKDLTQHLRKLHSFEIPPRTCPLCNETFPYQKKFYHHINNEHGKLRKCPQCGQDYTSKGKLRTHIKMVHEKASHTCEICGIVFKAEKNYKVHLMIHKNEEKSVKCPECDKCYYTIHELRRHQLIHKEKRYLCSQCDYTTVSRNILKRHVNTVHSDVRNFKCPTCGDAFKTKTTMEHHQISRHQDVRNFECDVCGKRFKKRTHLGTHKRIHTGDYYGSCCGINFVQKWNYKNHVAKFHSNE